MHVHVFVLVVSLFVVCALLCAVHSQSHCHPNNMGMATWSGGMHCIGFVGWHWEEVDLHQLE